MLNVSFAAEPHNAMVYVEALEHIKSALMVLAKAATLEAPPAKVERASVPQIEKPKAKPAPVAEPEPEVEDEIDEPVEEKKAGKPAAKPREKKAEKPAPRAKAKPKGVDLDELSGSDLIDHVRTEARKAGGVIGMKAIAELLNQYGATQLSELSDDDAREFIVVMGELVAEAKG